jgi:hypothetical protein
MTTRRSSWPWFAALGAALVVSGCAQQQAAPAPPPAPTALSITAQQGQSQSRQNADKAQCQSQASQFARSSHEWAQMFTECMSGRGYLVQ